VSGDLQIHIGDSLDTMGQRFVDAWHRAEHDVPDADQPERHVGFATFEQFTRIMTPRRLDLLRRVHRAPPRSIRSLALALGRDYRRVHEDVETLVSAGLLDRDATGLHADYASVRVETLITL